MDKATAALRQERDGDGTPMYQSEETADHSSSNLADAMKHLDVVIGENSELLGQLEERLAPILGMDRTASTLTAAGGEDVDPRSPAVRVVAEQTQRLIDHNQQVRGLLARLEV